MLRILCCLSFLLSVPAWGQSAWPEDAFERDELAAHLRFLASDELMGREAGTAEADIAARYIAERFRAAGLQPAPGSSDFLQPVPLAHTAPPTMGRLILQGDTLALGRQLIVLGGDAFEGRAPVVFAGYGLEEADYAGKDVRGKIVVTRAGRRGEGHPLAALQAAEAKRSLAAERGAAALIELYHGLSIPWASVAGYLSRPGTGLAPAESRTLPFAWIDDTEGAYLRRLEQDEPLTADLQSTGFTSRPLTSSNVAGVLEGADPTLRDEYVVLLAHYDHVGAGLDKGPGASPADSIFNGARDNAMGVVAVMAAAEALARQRPARSVLFLAVTAEEFGLLGSRYFADHPLVPLEKIVFGLNIDGGGYSDTSRVTIVDLGRTNADAHVQRAAAAYGLTAAPNPAPEQDFFNRSDNASFARKGVPVLTFSAGFRSFEDPGISNYYHRPQDEADEDFDYDYLLRFVQAYARAARLIADSPVRPAWQPGDEYEDEARALYGNR